MSYQYPYNNSYNNKKKNQGTYSVKLIWQLTGILIIILTLLLFKYVKTDITTNLNKKIKSVISLDYTKEVKTTLQTNVPNIDVKWKEFLNTLNIRKDFKIEYMPIEGNIVNNFGMKLNEATKKEELYKGIDISGKSGASVKAIYDGTVATITNDKTIGFSIVIDHNNGFKTTYSRLKEVKVKEGEMVTQGSIIALLGNNSNSKDPRLYFELTKNNKAVNPIDYLVSK
jgi:murein DD-endopeptidase MepM/ murein hydrolase activator NlpD